eukprot:11214547-Lingulodinium_polyedra.AAC.1
MDRSPAQVDTQKEPHEQLPLDPMAEHAENNPDHATRNQLRLDAKPTIKHAGTVRSGNRPPARATLSTCIAHR